MAEAGSQINKRTFIFIFILGQFFKIGLSFNVKLLLPCSPLPQK